MINSKQDLLFFLNQDARANKISSKYQYIKGLLVGNSRARVVRFLSIYRKWEYYNNISSPLRLYYKFLKSRVGSRYGIFISSPSIGYGLSIPHIEGGIIINCKSMGNNCIVNSGAVIGNKGKQNDRPIIGNNVEIAVGAKIIGNVVIGNQVIVAPNAVVVKDVPEMTIVGGVPARKLK